MIEERPHQKIILNKTIVSIFQYKFEYLFFDTENSFLDQIRNKTRKP